MKTADQANQAVWIGCVANFGDGRAIERRDDAVAATAQAEPVPGSAGRGVVK